MGQADPILTRLGAGPAVKKLVETALVLSTHKILNKEIMLTHLWNQQLEN